MDKLYWKERGEGRIFAIAKDEDCLQNPDKQNKVHDLETQIDQMVYQLYDLTPEEIAIVEGKGKIEIKDLRIWR